MLVTQIMGATLSIAFHNDGKNIVPLKGFRDHKTLIHSSSYNTPAPLNGACYLLNYLYEKHILSDCSVLVTG